MQWSDPNLIKVLNEGGVVVMPTDTLYGIVGKASDSKAVERIYIARQRTPEKPCIILLGDIGELEKFSVSTTEEQKNVIKNTTPLDSTQDLRPTSFILDCPSDRFTYLHRGTKTLAFRIPLQADLRELLLKTGPLIAPSANIEALPPSININEAKNYFGDLVDLYIDGGEIKGTASKVIKLNKDGSISVLRA